MPEPADTADHGGPSAAAGDPPRTPHLSISAHVVVQLGEELVTDIEQALLELAKNAYDADSEICEISIEPDWEPSTTDATVRSLSERFRKDDLGGPLGRIRIRDEGTGISASDVDGGWLKISSSVKRVKPGAQKAKTEKGRTPVGDKGLGRLATMKLGRILRMKTALEGESIWRTVTFSWEDFTNDRTLEDVPVYTATDLSEPVCSKGTIIEIIGIRDSERWREPGFIDKRLVPNLTALVSPFQIDDEFSISIKFGAVESKLEHLDQAVLNLAAARFDFSWDGSQLNLSASIAPHLFRGDRSEEAATAFDKLMHIDQRTALRDWFASDKRLKDRGLSFKVNAPWLCRLSETLPGELYAQNKAFPGGANPGPFSGTLHYFLFHQEIKQKLTLTGVSAATLQSMSQVAIFRDGFRVRAEKDWLRLHESATTGSSYYTLRPANVLGYFLVSNSENFSLVEKSDREGFVDNAEYRGFMSLGLRVRDYANSALESMRISVRDFQARQHVGANAQIPPTRKILAGSLEVAQTRAAKALKRIQSELSYAQSALTETIRSVDENGDIIGNKLKQRLELANEALVETAAQFDAQAKASKVLLQRSEEDADFSSRLLDAAAVGLAARSLAHELTNYLRQFRVGLATISTQNRQNKDPRITSALRDLAGITREFAKIISVIDPLLPGSRSLKENILVPDFLEAFVDARAPAAKRNGVALKYCPPSVPSPLMVRFSRTRLTQVVENLFQNSLYWLRNGPLPDPGRREIRVTPTSSGFSWEDSGPGIRNSLESSIFDPYISDKPREEASGLGLHIALTFLELERSHIRLAADRNSLGRRYIFDIDLQGAALPPLAS